MKTFVIYIFMSCYHVFETNITISKNIFWLLQAKYFTQSYESQLWNSH